MSILLPIKKISIIFLVLLKFVINCADERKQKMRPYSLTLATVRDASGMKLEKSKIPKA